VERRRREAGQELVEDYPGQHAEEVRPAAPSDSDVSRLVRVGAPVQAARAAMRGQPRARLAQHQRARA
jgi:hypothetical protein